MKVSRTKKIRVPHINSKNGNGVIHILLQSHVRADIKDKFLTRQNF